MRSVFNVRFWVESKSPQLAHPGINRPLCASRMLALMKSFQVGLLLSRVRIVGQLAQHRILEGEALGLEIHVEARREGRLRMA